MSIARALPAFKISRAKRSLSGGIDFLLCQWDKLSLRGSPLRGAHDAVFAMIGAIAILKLIPAASTGGPGS
jgi:hypothetical protein